MTLTMTFYERGNKKMLIISHTYQKQLEVTYDAIMVLYGSFQRYIFYDQRKQEGDLTI